MAKFEKLAKSEDELVPQLIERKLEIEHPQRVKGEDSKYRFLITINEDTNHKMFGTISCMLAMLLKINPKSSCKLKLKALFQEYLEISLDDMGFTKDWEDSKVWKDDLNTVRNPATFYN